jgi:drug/metabolite transporter (DMT)-like permease
MLSFIQYATIIGVLWGIYPLLNKAIIKESKISFTTLFGFYTLLLGILALVLLWFTQDQVRRDMNKMKTRQWIMLFFVGIFMLAATYLFNFSSVYISPYKTLAVTTALASIVSVIGSYYYFKLDVTFVKLVCIAIIIGGVYYLNKQPGDEGMLASD